MDDELKFRDAVAIRMLEVLLAAKVKTLVSPTTLHLSEDSDFVILSDMSYQMADIVRKSRMKAFK